MSYLVANMGGSPFSKNADLQKNNNIIYFYFNMLADMNIKLHKPMCLWHLFI